MNPNYQAFLHEGKGFAQAEFATDLCIRHIYQHKADCNTITLHLFLLIQISENITEICERFIIVWVISISTLLFLILLSLIVIYVSL